MSGSSLAFWVAAAVLLFWSVGAYNRLVRLRHALARRFATVDEQFRARQALLRRLADGVPADAPDAAAALDVLRAACAQVEAACDRARSRPAAAGTITSLRLAEDILAEARARLNDGLLADAGLAPLLAEVTAADSTLAYARRQFNDAVDGYNRAVRQFPTWVIAGPFGFRQAAAL